VRYEWDERKNRRNQRKHGGISFELATLVFREDCHGEEIVRIISARRAEKHEVRRYREQATD
jgi:uncharacterized DUF497 family protein